jgi:hypothetical protein
MHLSSSSISTKRALSGSILYSIPKKRRRVAITMQPPGPEESEHYFHGLSGCPRLIARTGSAPWMKPTISTPWPNPKDQNEAINRQLRSIGDHAILSAWSGELDRKLRESLCGCDWRFFFPIRVQITHTECSIKRCKVQRTFVLWRPVILPVRWPWVVGDAWQDPVQESCRQYHSGGCILTAIPAMNLKPIMQWQGDLR